MKKEKTYCGFITIVGRPNVGKSTLLNQLLGQKISITSKKPQTTRRGIIGIDTKSQYQTIYLDTPGINIKEKKDINNFINRATNSAINDAILVIFLVEGLQWTANDEMILHKLKNVNCPILLAINKIDKISEKITLLPYIEYLRKKNNFFNIVPISAKKGIRINTISKIIQTSLPESKHYFPDHLVTDQPYSFLVSEIIREKLMRFLNKELPYVVSVKIQKFTLNIKNNYSIQSWIIVNHERQKKIVIGNKGKKIKLIGSKAREDIQKILKTKVFLELWVKVKSSL